MGRKGVGLSPERLLEASIAKCIGFSPSALLTFWAESLPVVGFVLGIAVCLAASLATCR